MDAEILIVVLLLIALAAIAWFYIRRRKSEKLKARFGPEYEDAVHRHGDRSRAEAELAERANRVKSFEIRELSDKDREYFENAWRRNQAHFVDNPPAAIEEADKLVVDVMDARGYPMADFEHRAADLSVDHPHVVRNYRAAHEIAVRHSRGEASTEDLRKAMVYYRELFAELLRPYSVREEVKR